MEVVEEVIMWRKRNQIGRSRRSGRRGVERRWRWKWRWKETGGAVNTNGGGEESLEEGK